MSQHDVCSKYNPIHHQDEATPHTRLKARRKLWRQSVGWAKQRAAHQSRMMGFGVTRLRKNAATCSATESGKIIAAIGRELMR